MFFVRQIPVVIEPGVAVLEAELLANDPKAGGRTMAAHFFRLALDEKIAPKLPLVPTSEHPHVFSLTEDLDSSPVLLVYDILGRLSLLYSRDDRGTWERHAVVDEHAGRSVTQFSVRFCFNTLKDRTKFLDLIGEMTERSRNSENIAKADMNAAVALLARSRVAPVVLPVAVAKNQLRSART
jgi:hypothetical protein